MIYLSAGHWKNESTGKQDPGAVANGVQENDLCTELRDLILPHLAGYRVTTDKDSETLSQYLARIKPGDASVVVELHFNAASPSATGAEVLVADKHNTISKDLAEELSTVIASNLCIKNRGVKTESQSARGKLAFVRQEGACALVEVCFITNKDDLKAYQDNKEILAQAIAYVLKKFDDKII